MNKLVSSVSRSQSVTFGNAKSRIPGALTLACLMLTLPGGLAAQALPENDGREHLGVKSCSASTCHGSVTERNSYDVLQNEYQTWTKHDRHSRAYETLLSERSQRIARNLGIGKAHEAKICLDCHADNVEAGRRGRFFNLSDGVGCEACHGGSEEWLGPHISAAASHEGNLRAGMYPTEVPAARAKLCLSCHLGTGDKFANHRIMGAGHPRLTFELRTFTELQPAHFRKDADYRRRKSVQTAAVEWTDGLLAAAAQSLELMQQHYAAEGPFPEFALFDCHGCHHSFEQLRWQASTFSGEDQPGRVRLEDSRLRMVALLEEHVMQSTETAQGLRALHAATGSSQSEFMQAVAQLGRQIEAVGPRLRQRAAGGGGPAAFRAAIYTAAAAGRFNDYADAEQAAMAAQILGGTDLADPGISAVFEALRQPDDFDPGRAASALSALGGMQPTANREQARAATTTPSGPGRLMVVKVPSLRMRSGPGPDEPVIGSVAGDTVLRVIDQSGDWSRIKGTANNREFSGWVASRLLAPVER